MNRRPENAAAAVISKDGGRSRGRRLRGACASRETTAYTSNTVDPVVLRADGLLAVPDAPGIGIELNEAAVKERLEPEFKML